MQPHLKAFTYADFLHSPGIAYTYTEPLTYFEYIYDIAKEAHERGLWNILVALRDADTHIEITNLLIPGVNDQEDMIRFMCQWLRENGFSSCPLHFSRFFPRYKMLGASPTPKETLYLAERIAKEEGMERVYLGNL